MNYLFRLFKLRSARNKDNIERIIKALGDANQRIRQEAMDYITYTGDCRFDNSCERLHWITGCCKDDLRTLANGVKDIIEKWKKYRSGLEDEIMNIDPEFLCRETEQARFAARRKLHDNNISNHVLSYLLKIFFEKHDVAEIISIVKRECDNYGTARKSIEVEYNGRYRRTFHGDADRNKSFDRFGGSIKEFVKDGWRYNGHSGSTDYYSWDGMVTTYFSIPVPVSS